MRKENLNNKFIFYIVLIFYNYILYFIIYLSICRIKLQYLAIFSYNLFISSYHIFNLLLQSQLYYISFQLSINTVYSILLSKYFLLYYNISIFLILFFYLYISYSIRSSISIFLTLFFYLYISYSILHLYISYSILLSPYFLLQTGTVSVQYLNKLKHTYK